MSMPLLMTTLLALAALVGAWRRVNVGAARPAVAALDPAQFQLRQRLASEMLRADSAHAEYPPLPTN